MGWKFKVYRLINRGLEPVGLALRRFHSDVNVCVMESPPVRARQINIFRNAMAKSLASFPGIAQSLPSEERIRTFAEELLRCPIVQDTGEVDFLMEFCYGQSRALWTRNLLSRVAYSGDSQPGYFVKPAHKHSSTRSTFHFRTGNASSLASFTTKMTGRRFRSNAQKEGVPLFTSMTTSINGNVFERPPLAAFAT